jgi:hypothetical protein
MDWADLEVQYAGPSAEGLVRLARANRGLSTLIDKLLGLN